MTKINSYKDLIVWQKSIELVEQVFLLTEKFPKPELFGITSQMRHASVSIPSLIAEGFGRKSIRYNHQFFSMSFGSALELETQTIISKKLKLTPPEDFDRVEGLLLEVCKMLNKMTGKEALIANS